MRGNPSGRDPYANMPSEFRTTAVHSLAYVEKEYVLTVLADQGGNRTQTARILQIGQNTLWRKLKAWKVPPARTYGRRKR